MKRSDRIRSLRLVGVRTSVVLLALAFATPSPAQEAGLNAPANNGATVNEFLGVDRCRSCHRAATPEQVRDGVTDFVSLTESVVWVADVHSRAFELIDPSKSELGKRICDKLGITNIHESRACLSCHSDWRPNVDKPPPTYERGVACESCHGASQKWDLPHSKADWRAKSVAEKESLGMIDVRNPIKRAEQCFGCHIGNAPEGKVVTHEMYAAGHPPLPGVEIESFAQQMPRHWRYLEEKIADAKLKPTGNDADADPFTHFKEFVIENHKYFKPENGSIAEQVAGHKHRPAAVILGGAIALREYLELTRDLATTAEPGKYAWPELATLDCRACHHDLEVPSRRQEQRAGSIPGRPTIPRWPTALVPLAIRHASTAASYDEQLALFHEKLAAVQAEWERTPFGSPSRVQSACSDLLEWLEIAVIQPALEKPFDNRAIGDSFKLLIEIGCTDTHDYDSARQIGWATRILSCGIARKDIRDAIDIALEPLGQKLQLDLPNGPVHSCAPPTKLDESRQLIPLDRVLPATLSAPYEYNPNLFREQLQKLRESLR